MDEQNEGSWQYKPDDNKSSAQTADSPAPSVSGGQSTPAKPKEESISWTASEYVDHAHGAGWYLSLIAGTAAVAAAIYFLTKDYFATGVTVVVGVIVGVFAGRKPKEVSYEISSSGLKVGEKSYGFSQFKSFAVMREGNLSSINLLPLKRFMPPISAYFAPDDEERIVNALGNYLPYEERKLDGVDRLTRRLRL